MNIPEGLRSARRQLLAISEFKLLEDFVWHTELNSWALRFSIVSNIPNNEFLPRETNWYIVISSFYPWGEIKIYPDKVNGIQHTFQHQDYNCVSDKHPWRDGDICVNTSLIKWARAELVDEPFDSSLRLPWYITRTIEWIKAAAAGELSSHGDPFELPQLPNRNDLLLAFNEDERSFNTWSRNQSTCGTCKIRSLSNVSSVLIAEQYDVDTGIEIRNEWGSHLTHSMDKEYFGIWIVLTEIPVLSPWALPYTWGEFFEAGVKQGKDIKQDLQNIYIKHKRTSFRFIMIGFPISETIGGSAIRIHWLCIQVSSLKRLNGYMNLRNEIRQSTEFLFARKAKVQWVETANWNKQQITGRGTLPAAIQKSKILLVGAGAVGSLFLEMLVRMGCEKIMVVDNDLISVGNLSRHTLTMESVLKPKAQSLAERLNQIFPFVDAKFKNQSLQDITNKDAEFINQFDIVVDATASDHVVSLLSKFLSATTQTFVSLSTGIMANRLFGFVSNVQGEDLERMFREKLSPILQQERAEHNGTTLIRDGIGCWHPIFPARIDDINLLVDVFIKTFEKIFFEENRARLVIIEKQTNDQGNFSGIQTSYF